MLLAWYDLNRRKLPWRAEPGEPVDPYRVWLSEIMLQQTTVKAVAPYFVKFLERWPTLRLLAAAAPEEVLQLWAGLGYYARARHLHACACALVREHGGRFPDDPKVLRALPGIGRYTAGAIAAIAFGRREVPVDGNVARVVARLFAVGEPWPLARPRIHDLAQSLSPPARAGDFAQALMDLGAMLCTPLQPACRRCPWAGSCAACREGQQAALPPRAQKRAVRLRRGAAFFVLRADGSVLVRTRPPTGLLGGMTELPTTAWTTAFNEALILDEVPTLPSSHGGPTWRRLPGRVGHAFTHFRLELVIYATAVPAETQAPVGMRFIDRDTLAAAALPNLMRKVLKFARYEAAGARGQGDRPP